MPSIPRYQRQQSIPGQSGNVPVNPSSAGQVGSAIAQFGDTLAKEVERVQTEERHYSTLRLGNLVNEDTLTFEQDRLSMKGMDAYNSMEAVDKWEKDLRTKYLDGLNDQKVQRDVDQHITSQALKLRNSLSNHEARQRDLVAEDTRVKTLESSTKAAYQGFGTLEDNMATFNNAIINDPRLRDSDRENKIIAGQSAIAASRLDGIIDRNPDAAEELMKTGLFDQYLDTDKLKSFHDKIERVRKDQKAQAKEQERIDKETLKAQQLEVGNDFINKLVDGQLTQEEVVRSGLDPTGENSKAYWLNQIKERNKKSTEEWKTDPAIEADFFDRIVRDPQSVTDDQLLGAQGKGLSTATTKELMNYRAKLLSDDPLKSETAKTAIARLRDAKSARLFSGNRAENSKRWGDSVNLLKRYIVNNPDADPKEFVETLLEKEKDGYIRRVFDFLPNVDPYQSPEERQRQLEEEAGPPLQGKGRQRPTTTGPTLDQFLEKARAANPGVSDDELTSYYQDKYANR